MKRTPVARRFDGGAPFRRYGGQPTQVRCREAANLAAGKVVAASTPDRARFPSADGTTFSWNPTDNPAVTNVDGSCRLEIRR